MLKSFYLKSEIRQEKVLFLFNDLLKPLASRGKYKNKQKGPDLERKK